MAICSQNFYFNSVELSTAAQSPDVGSSIVEAVCTINYQQVLQALRVRSSSRQRPSSGSGTRYRSSLLDVLVVKTRDTK